MYWLCTCTCAGLTCWRYSHLAFGAWRLWYGVYSQRYTTTTSTLYLGIGLLSSLRLFSARFGEGRGPTRQLQYRGSGLVAWVCGIYHTK